MIAISLGAATLLYMFGVWRAYEAGRGGSVGARAIACFTLGILTLAVALIWPLHELSEKLFAAHMLQHELLMVVAAPLLAFSSPGVALIWALRGRTRREIATVQRTVSRSALASPATACFAQAAALWIWHVPRLYDLALDHDVVHALQHASFLGTAIWFWWSLSHSRFHRLGFGPAVFYLFATAVQSGALGALLAVSPWLWYSADTSFAERLGLTRLEDQQLAGLLMWVPASLIFTAAGLYYLAAWIHESERRVRATEG